MRSFAAAAGTSYSHAARATALSAPSWGVSPIYQTTRAASLNSAIERGLRKSQGVGFRGKDRTTGYGSGPLREERASSGRSSDGGRKTFESAWASSADRPRRSDNGNLRGGDRRRGGGRRESLSEGPRIRRGKVEVKSDEDKPRRSRAARFNDPDSRFGRRSLERRGKLNGDGEQHEADEQSQDVSYRREYASDDRMRRDRAYSSDDRKRESRDSTRQTGPFKAGREGEAQPLDKHRRQGDSTSDSRSPTRTKPDRNLPISIPYTTAASQFLYGASVVEAALRSKRIPRRQLYKLYIYSSNDPSDRAADTKFDAQLERLARSARVPVQRVEGSDWGRVMSKMSDGRPHNGYILEASPLPRLPVLHLGAVSVEGGTGPRGFKVVLDHQSPQEAKVNGTDDFLPLPSPPRKAGGTAVSAAQQQRYPLVLLLDRIVDPGNLGGIIRTASFLGVTAVAVSVHHSAPFTPVVLKASAGGSENVTLFTVRKTAGFLQSSRENGWKVYAAVAPSGSAPTPGGTTGSGSRGMGAMHQAGDELGFGRTSGAAATTAGGEGSSNAVSLTTDELARQDPLRDHPVILVLGNEGEGLRWGLRSKADVELSISGSGMSGSVDSLNVSVAAGILTSAFLGRRT
jgi:21S rRNA (GM2251-2'-O)-methyltransferase